MAASLDPSSTTYSGVATGAVALSFDAHAVNYLTTADGSADLLDGVQLVAQCIHRLPLTSTQFGALEDLRRTSSDSRSMLVLLRAVTYGFKFVQRASEYVEADARSSEVAKRAILQGIDFINAASEGVLFLHHKQWVDLGSTAPWANGIFQVTTLLSDGVDVWDQWTAIEEIHGQRAASTTSPNALLDEREWLCLVKLIKDISSIVLSAIALGLLIFEIVVESVPLLPTLTLGLSVLFIVCKIYAYFYEKICIENSRLSRVL